MKKTKGFTLVETVVAMTLVALIMLAATSTVLFAEKTAQRTKIHELAINEVENLLHCYQSGDFGTAVQFVYDTAVEDGSVTVYFDGKGGIASAEDYRMRITVTATSGFSAAAYDHEGDLIYEYENQ